MATSFTNHDMLIAFEHNDFSFIANQVQIASLRIIDVEHWAFHIILVQYLLYMFVKLITSYWLKLNRRLCPEKVITVRTYFIW